LRGKSPKNEPLGRNGATQEYLETICFIYYGKQFPVKLEAPHLVDWEFTNEQIATKAVRRGSDLR
jgi:hypothetical protein